MGHEPLSGDHSGMQALADAHWNALLARLRARAAGESADARLLRVRRAIATGGLHISAPNIARSLIERLLAS